MILAVRRVQAPPQRAPRRPRGAARPPRARPPPASSPDASPAVAMLRDAVTRPPAGPGANAGARSSIRPPWAPMPGSRKGRGASAHASARRARERWRRPRRRRPPGRRPGRPARPPGRPGAPTAARRRPAGPRRRPRRDSSAHEQERPGAGRPRRLEQGLEGVPAQQRVGGEGVGAQAGDLPERVGVAPTSACAYAAAVTGTSPRLPSAMTSRPAARACSTIRPGPPSPARRAARSTRAAA